MRLTREHLNRLAAQRILVLDGAMGTMIQSYGLQEADFRGGAMSDQLADHPQDLQGNNDLLCLTRPDVISEIHRGYLAAGADIITTNTFNGTSVAQRDYGTAHLVRDINLAAARLAREAADEFTAADPDRPRYVAGSLAPTNRTCSISPDVNDPGLRNITYRDLVEAYTEEAEALLDGGADILMIETVFDPLNAKAAVYAVRDLLARRGLQELPVWISGTITDASGRTLTGQTPEAFWISLQHADAAVFGLNCALGAAALRPFVAEIAGCADTLVSAHPNAGLPNELGGYDETPEQMAAQLAEFARDGLVNIVGGCCGTTPEFIRAFAEAVRDLPPRTVPAPRTGTFLAGLEPLRIDADSLFVNVGERTNVAGSRKFARLIREEKWEEALEVAREQVRGGAQIIDVNMDDALLDAPASMATFLNVVASDPEIARVPVMIDSSDWQVLEAGLERIQGKGIVNSLSLKDGEDEFRRRARRVQRYGAAAVVMAFDEQGQADSLERRLEICNRAWRILAEEGFAPTDIIFDPNVYAVATGMSDHDRYAVDFIETCRRLKQDCPGALISGGISNLSFSFRGNNTVREAMHSVFLYHAITAGLDMGIVNAGQLAVYQEIEPELLKVVEDVVLARDAGATEKLTELAQGLAGRGRAQTEDLSWRERPVGERLSHALLTGEAKYVQDDALEALAEKGSALLVIEGPLMDGMNQVGDLFGAGKMFLPQVIRSARVMKRAVAVLEPYLEAAAEEASASAGRIVMATVKGDVHDIGKNIVGVVLGCNGYEVIDLGVMVPAEKIIAAVREHNPDAVGLSGLITPSLHEMVHVADELTRAGIELPLLIGGATTSKLHTALRIAPAYAPGVFHVPDASRAAGKLSALLQPGGQQREAATAETEYARLREVRAGGRQQRPLLDWDQARSNRLQLDWTGYQPPRPAHPGLHVFEALDLRELCRYIDWTPFFHTWKLPGAYPAILDDAKAGPEARRLLDAAGAMLDELIDGGELRGRAALGLFGAQTDGDDLLLDTGDGDRMRVPFLRQQRRSSGSSPNRSLVDYVAPADSDRADWVGAFVVTAGLGADIAARRREEEGDDFSAILIQALADRLAEASAEWLHERVRREYWGYAADEALDNAALIREQYRGIRPAPGYPACPDHAAKSTIFELLGAERNCGTSLTENWAMQPAATVSGWYFSHPESRYFGLGRIGRDQLADYAARCGIDEKEAARRLAPHLD